MLRRWWVILFVILLFILGGCLGERKTSTKNTGDRHIINLDGNWEISQGSMDLIPSSFEHKVPVPGLVDMAKPAFEEVGKKSERRRAFWYRRRFTVEGQIPDVAILKIHKAKYGTKVFLNGKLVGEHLPCFTPALLDVKKFLKGSGKQNELIVRVGADRECLPEGMPGGWDFEKYLYIPGIYDSVELILTGAPYISNVQVVPQLGDNTVRINSLIQNPTLKGKVEIDIRVRELKSQRTHCFTESTLTRVKDALEFPFDLELPMGDYKLWSPEEPFLYEVELNIGTDIIKTRFGMRSFRFDKESGRAILNGKTYFMRGTNVCAYRFFEDTERGDKPWRKEWVRRLHRKFKSMHWNSIRYCIGFPPELWYEIADEEGFLIQDEFPIWLLSEAPENPKSEKIIPEYTEWMRERWNHPCVVIWDAQNESVTEETGKALSAVRHLDLSNRPWDNGWAEPQSDDDCVETHPYFFSKLWNEYWADDNKFALSDMAKISGRPSVRKEQENFNLPIIINEYGWLWLNRDGSTTCLTGSVYEKLLGPDSTIAERRLLYARYLAALTEFWRVNRECAGVLHFCGLGYSRAGDKPRPEGGATSDHFIDLEKLAFEPYFEQYVRDAFSPVGLMINFWDEELAGGTERRFSVFVINDLHRKWKGTVRFLVMRSGQIVTEQSKGCAVSGLGREILSFEQRVPDRTGEYQLVTELVTADGNVVRSLRDFKVVPAGKK
ncbi:MAG TPA: glycoside hydrolase family 2 TIM barrel-domain containing protein [Sedimentisphaerales bacterium]|nr:glycoside hydrolase family 2 TIM barrel-domain containing protein [Sedimentisphaerales bacterium]